MTLNKKQRAVMEVIFREARKKDGLCILTPDDILTGIPYKTEFSEEELPATVNSLKLDGYIEYEEATKKGEKVYCITLTTAGEGYEREKKRDRIKVYKKLAVVVGTAILGVIIKQIVSAIIG